MDLATARVFDLAGHVIETTDASGVVTRTKTIILDDGGRIELSSLPKGGIGQRHRITQKHYEANGKLRRERSYAAKDPFATVPDPGTLTRHLLYEEGRDDKGRYTQVTDIANLFDRRITRTYSNDRGQPVEVIHAYGTSFAASEFFHYARDGKLIRHIDPDGATTRHAYNDKGERIITALDLKVEPGEAPDHIDYEVDRITRTTTELATNADGLEVRRVTNEVFTENGPVITSIQEQSLDGTYSATIQNGQRATRQRAEGDQPGQWTITVTQPDGSHTVGAYENGRLARTTRHASDGTAISWIEQHFDAYGRLWQITDSRTGTTTVFYDENGRRWKVSAPVSAPNPETRSSTEGTLDILYHFDALGQVITISNPAAARSTGSTTPTGPCTASTAITPLTSSSAITVGANALT